MKRKGCNLQFSPEWIFTFLSVSLTTSAYRRMSKESGGLKGPFSSLDYVLHVVRDCIVLLKRKSAEAQTLNEQME